MAVDRRAALVTLASSLLGLGASGCRGPAGAAGPRATRSALQSPYRVEARRPLFAGTRGHRVAARLGAPVRDLLGVSYYVDDARSVPDRALRAQNEAVMQPVRAFVTSVAGLADDWLRGEPPAFESAARAVEALASWARAGALLGVTNRQGAFELKWTLGGLALAYLKVKDAPGPSASRRARVEDWLREVALRVTPAYERRELVSNRNNHAYWAGMAVAAAGIAADDDALFAWGMSRARIGIEAVQPDGVLPLELARQSLALHYHVFALTPLILLAEMGEANGVPLYAENERAIRRLAERVISGLQDPAGFARLTLARQKIELPPSGTRLSWAEPYHARFPDPRLAAWLGAARPLVDRRLGGDVTLAFGAPRL